MTVCVVLATLIPILRESGISSDVMKPIAAPLVGGMITSTIYVLILMPVFFALTKERAMRRGSLPPAGGEFDKRLITGWPGKFSVIQKWQWPGGLNRRSLGNTLRIRWSKIDVPQSTELISDQQSFRRWSLVSKTSGRIRRAMGKGKVRKINFGMVVARSVGGKKMAATEEGGHFD
jgi:hypothetical protein